MICNTGRSKSGWTAKRLRKGIENDSTDWRTGTVGMTWSTRWAAASAMRRVPHEGQMPGRLQEKATNFSSAQPSKRNRRKPWARMPQARNASNSSVTNVGRPAPHTFALRNAVAGFIAAASAQRIQSHAFATSQTARRRQGLQVNAMDATGNSAARDAGHAVEAPLVLAWAETRTPQEICAAHG